MTDKSARLKNTGLENAGLENKGQKAHGVEKKIKTYAIYFVC